MTSASFFFITAHGTLTGVKDKRSLTQRPMTFYDPPASVNGQCQLK